MDDATIRHLNAINRKFYEITAQSFDATRGTAWPGWIKLRDYLPKQETLSVLDVGCGNGRFGVFLAEETIYKTINYVGVDNNAALLDSAQSALKKYAHVQVQLIEQDVVQALEIDGQYDLVVLFGVIHHVPGYENRQQFMKQLTTYVKTDGLLAFAAWRFYEFERFRERLASWPDDLANKVEQNDYLLDWRRGDVALRYCHYVDDEELDALVRAMDIEEVTRYRADGATGTMNSYVVLKNF